MRPALNSNSHPGPAPHTFRSSPVRPFKPVRAHIRCASCVPTSGFSYRLPATGRISSDIFSLHGPTVSPRVRRNAAGACHKKERNVAEPLACECRDPAPEPGRVSDSTAPMRPNCSSKTHPDLPPNAYYSPRVRPFKSFPQDVFCASEVPVLLTVPFPSPRAASVRAPGGEKQDSISGHPRREGGSCDE